MENRKQFIIAAGVSLGAALAAFLLYKHFNSSKIAAKDYALMSLEE